MKYRRLSKSQRQFRSPPSRAAWIEIFLFAGGGNGFGSPPSRAAWIEIRCEIINIRPRRSPPSRAAWIEMSRKPQSKSNPSSRRLHGRRGLKSPQKSHGFFCSCRRLHGRRGLKYDVVYDNGDKRMSPPSRAAWIEIGFGFSFPLFDGSPPSRAAWIEICVLGLSVNLKRSPPSRAAWIEILYRKLSVCLPASPPSRAAWIEMGCTKKTLRRRKRSPPSRAAWIEIVVSRSLKMYEQVAAFTGGVD